MSSKIHDDVEIFFADFECLTKDSEDFKKIGHTDVYLWYVKNIDDTFEQMGYDLDSFIKWTNESGKSKLIYFHNLSYDGNFIIKWYLRNKPEQYSFLGHELKTSNKWEFFANGNRIYSIDVKNKKWKYNSKGEKIKKKWTIYYRCTYNLLSSSIASLGKGFDIGKHNEETSIANFYDLGGFNMDVKIKRIYEEYIKRDVEIARLSYLNFRKVVEDELHDFCYSKKFKKTNVSLKNTLTVGSLGYKMTKNYIYNVFGKSIFSGYSIKKDDYIFAKNWFYGGWTQFNPEIQNKMIDVDGCVVDINSSYPTQMTKLLPYGKLSLTKPKGKYLEYYQVEIESAIIKPEYKNLLILKKWDKDGLGRYVKYMGKGTLYYCKDEWEIIQKVYDLEIKNITIWYAKADYLLKDFMQGIYNFKTTTKAQGHIAESNSYKILMNAIYGKQCTRMQFDAIFYCKPDMKEELLKLWEKDELLELEDGEGKLRYYEIVGDSRKTIDKLGLVAIRVREVLSDKKKFTNILIGAQITSYARVQLWKAILDVGNKYFLYSDTDSIIFNKPKKDVEKILPCDKYKLGYWDVEAEIVKGKILGAKRYAFINKEGNKLKFAFAGIKNDKITLENWDQLIQSDIEIQDGVFKRCEDDYGIYFDYGDYKTKLGSN